MWTPLQTEMLAEAKADQERRLDDTSRIRQARAVKRPRRHAITAATASALRRTADRLDPAPPRRARTTGWASG
jgi:hypothetical protein